MQHLPRNQHGMGDAPRVASRGWRLASWHILALAAAGLLTAAEPHHVTAVRFWSLGNVTRVAIETDGDFEMKSDRLDNPDRLFFDIEGTRPSLVSGKSVTTIPVGDHLVRQIRVAEPQHNVTRVVLDLEGPVEAITSRLDNPRRLMVELRAVGTSPAVTKAPVTPEPAPAPAVEVPAPRVKPVERRPFTPPPSRPPAITPAAQHPQEVAMLDTPPQVQLPYRYAWPQAAASLPRDWGSNIGEAAQSGARAARGATAPANVNISAKLATNAPGGSIPSGATAAPVETALPAKRNTSGDRSMIRVLGLKINRIVLDPGHGGHDTGTVGPEGLREKDLVLDVSQRLGRIIETRMGSEVIFTRSDDTFVPLERRTEIANDAKADLFLSIHANSSPLRSAAGVETYYLNFTTSKSALDLASRENSGSQLNVADLQGLLEKIALKDKIEESREFASRVQAALYTLSAKTDSRSRDRGVKKAPFIVLIGASMPAVLAEIGFVSNAHDESVMRREEYRERMAEALYKGISAYASSLSHFQVAQRH